MRKSGKPELWGGIECTVSRVGDEYRDQIVETGHRHRIDDLDQVASLGVRTVRYPVVWETVSRGGPEGLDWSWHDGRLERLRSLGMVPVAGLVHHGSGPPWTNLLDPAFPELLARYAEEVAARYPWIDMFTPVNEPLTTARFAGLYGHWYPHGRSYSPFLRALVIQVKAVLLSMRAIRRVTPAARLVQTEDLGKTFSTPMLRFQADHENERRWLSFDLLCGRVDRRHPWHRRLLEAGVPEGDLALLLEGDGAPDILGINHYLTSERFLDQRLRRYPPVLWGGNGRQRYADVEAVRVSGLEADVGPKARLLEAWQRYRRPLAVTEVHHGCTREEQVRWLMDVWQAACELREEGADLRAVTVWSLFGAVDWNTLLTQRNGFYEPGAFDIRSDPPRPTLLAEAARSLAAQGSFSHPVLDAKGWWKRHERFYQSPKLKMVRGQAARRILVAGSAGRIGRGVERLCAQRGLETALTRRQELDITDAAALRAALERTRPWAVVNAAGAGPARAEIEPESSRRDNVEGARTLATICAELGLPLVTFSSALVFDGGLGRPYGESDEARPFGSFGHAKREAEAAVLAAHPGALVVRVGTLLSAWDADEPLLAAVRDLAGGAEVALDDREVLSPAYLPDLVHAALDLLIDGETGIWHLAHPGGMTRYAMAARAALAAGFDITGLVRHRAGPARSLVLSSERGRLLPSSESAIDRWARDAEPFWRDLRDRRLAEAAE